ncbi:MAG: PH domain-containing protein [Youngiibacter sp.]|nr:PH domain-containing protein [Youngiibacter sp.]
MVYKAENSSMGDSMLIASIAALALFSVLFNMSQIAVLKTVFAMLMLVSAMMGAYYVTLIRTLQYRLTNDTLHIEGLFGFVHEEIPASSISGYTRRITLISRNGLMGYIVRKYYIGSSFVDGVGNVKMYITNSKSSIYIGTDFGIFGISPEAPLAFSAHMDDLKVPLVEKLEYSSNADHAWSERRFRLLLRYVSIVLALAAALPFLARSAGFLPPYVSEIFSGGARASFMPTEAYLRDHILFCAINAVILAAAAAISRYYMKIDTIYYYRLLYAPLAMTLAIMVLMVNVLIPLLVW